MTRQGGAEETGEGDEPEHDHAGGGRPVSEEPGPRVGPERPSGHDRFGERARKNGAFSHGFSLNRSGRGDRSRRRARRPEHRRPRSAQTTSGATKPLRIPQPARSRRRPHSERCCRQARLTSGPLLNTDSARADWLRPLAYLALYEAAEVIRAAPLRGDQHGTQALQTISDG